MQSNDQKLPEQQENNPDPVLAEWEEEQKQPPPYLFLALIAGVIVWLCWSMFAYDETAVEQAMEKKRAEMEKFYDNAGELGGVRELMEQR